MKNLFLPILAFFPMLCAVISYIVGRRSKKARDILACIFAGAELAAVIFLILSIKDTAVFSIQNSFGLGLNFKFDGFRKVYCTVIAFMWFMTMLFSREYFSSYRNRNRYYFFNLMTLGATTGVFLAADLYTAFVFFEIMSFTSYPWVAHEEEPAAMKAAGTYLGVAVIGGLAALMGLFLLYSKLGTLSLDELYTAAASCSDKGTLYTAGGLVLFGFGAKAGMFPLHIWLPKAHPVAPAPASALLSGILTKAGVFGILAISCNVFRYDPTWGAVILTLGVITMVLGAVLALLSIDLKRTLACSSMSQIGFILVGIGMMGLLGEENALAARGALMHMVNHSLIKLTLFMSAGVVYMNLHKLNLNDIRGFGRKKPLLNIAFLLGALGIGGIPLFNGYVSKTLLHESIVEYSHMLSGSSAALITTTEWLFLISGGITVAYMTKLYIALFVEKHPNKQAEFDAKRKYMSGLSSLALVGSAAVLPVLGMIPNATLDSFADASAGFFSAALPEHAISYLSFSNLKGAAISIAIGAVLYLCIVRPLLMRRDALDIKLYINRLPERLDLENAIYRPLILKILPAAFGWVMSVFGENRIFTPVCRYTLKGATVCAAAFGENKLLSPLSKAAMSISAVLSRAACDLTDGIVLLLRKTVFKDVRPRKPEGVDARLSHKAGEALDSMSALISHHDRDDKYAKRAVRIEETVSKTTRRITGNLSFALLMACIGICIVFLFVLLLKK